MSVESRNGEREWITDAMIRTMETGPIVDAI